MPIRIDIPVVRDDVVPDGMYAAALRVVHEQMPRMAYQLSKKTPKKTGELARAWQVTKIKNGAAILNRTRYARFVRRGRYPRFVYAFVLSFMRNVIAPLVGRAIVAWIDSPDGQSWVLGIIQGGGIISQQPVPRAYWTITVT